MTDQPRGAEVKGEFISGGGDEWNERALTDDVNVGLILSHF